MQVEPTRYSPSRAQFKTEEGLPQSCFCPLCSSAEVRRVVENATLSRQDEPGRDEPGNATGGMVGYRCPNGHIFFVRSCDVEAWADSAEFP